jgi:hypothetical protein
MENGEWRMENGEWRMENGEWRMENGEWRMENGEFNFESKPLVFRKINFKANTFSSPESTQKKYEIWRNCLPRL